jgi:hypothetical protein
VSVIRVPDARRDIAFVVFRPKGATAEEEWPLGDEARRRHAEPCGLCPPVGRSFLPFAESYGAYLTA